MASPSPGARFLTLVDVAEVLNTSSAQVYALVRGGDLPAIKIGGRGQWRVESSELEKYIAADVRADPRLRQHPPVRPAGGRATAREAPADPATSAECRGCGSEHPGDPGESGVRHRAHGADLTRPPRVADRVFADLDEVQPDAVERAGDDGPVDQAD